MFWFVRRKPFVPPVSVKPDPGPKPADFQRYGLASACKNKHIDPHYGARGSICPTCGEDLKTCVSTNTYSHYDRDGFWNDFIAKQEFHRWHKGLRKTKTTVEVSVS